MVNIHRQYLPAAYNRYTEFDDACDFMVQFYGFKAAKVRIFHRISVNH